MPTTFSLENPVTWTSVLLPILGAALALGLGQRRGVSLPCPVPVIEP